jgi:uncharacterized paraquat-inducible protein A
MKKLTLILLVLTFASIVTDVAAQCPMCKTSLEEARKNGSEVGSTLNNGILYLLALPYTIAMVFGFIYWRNRKQKAA